jgi:hypothetical protein
MVKRKMEIDLIHQTLAFGERPRLSFAYRFSTGKTELPNFEDVYNPEGSFERFTNDPASIIPSLIHESLHQWINEEEGKTASLQLDNIDKDELEENYVFSQL